jgi:hypothetical protein
MTTNGKQTQAFNATFNSLASSTAKFRQQVPEIPYNRGMEKKIKLDELPDEIRVEEKTQAVSRISLKAISAPPQEEIPVAQKLERAIDKNRTVKKVIEPIIPVIKKPAPLENVFFVRNSSKSFWLRSLSLVMVLVMLDLVMHFIKSIEGVDVMDWENYQSLFLIGGDGWWPLKICALLLVAYMLTPNSPIAANAKGIYASQVQLLNIFYTSQLVYIPWQDIHSVSFESRFFEPYMFFYGKNKEKLGQIEFTPKDGKAFFKYIASEVGKGHPIVLAKEKFDFF